jgi:hypothetical protein
MCGGERQGASEVFCGKDNPQDDQRLSVEFHVWRLPVWLQITTVFYGPFHDSVSQWCVTTQAWVQSQASLFMIYGG